MSTSVTHTAKQKKPKQKSYYVLKKLRPYVTEKTLKLAKNHKIYTFAGPTYLTKTDVKAILEEIFGPVSKVRVVKIKAKERGKFLLRKPYTKPAFKKFYVKFKKDVTVPWFDKLS